MVTLVGTGVALTVQVMLEVVVPPFWNANGVPEALIVGMLMLEGSTVTVTVLGAEA